MSKVFSFKKGVKRFWWWYLCTQFSDQQKMNLRTIEKLCDPLEGGRHQKTPALFYISQMLNLIGLTLSGLTLLE